MTASSITFEVAARTDVGRRREHNEDAFLVADLTEPSSTTGVEEKDRLVWPVRPSGARGALFMVADGMGGAAAGELASGMATSGIAEEVTTRWAASGQTDPDAFAQTLRLATEVANQRIHAHATSHPDTRGMGTTVTLAGMLHDTLYLCQVGDSRAYLIRRGVATQITKDQSLMQRLIDAGELTPEEAEVSERRNIILQALGPEARVKVDLTVQRVQRGDLLLLCSDGLSGQVRGPEMAQLLAAAADLDRGCAALIERANATGGPDNITVVAVRFDGAGLPPTLAEPPGHSVYEGAAPGRATVPVDRAAVAAAVEAAASVAPTTSPTLPTAAPSPASATPATPTRPDTRSREEPSLAPSLTVFALLVVVFVVLAALLS